MRGKSLFQNALVNLLRVRQRIEEPFGLAKQMDQKRA